MTKSVPTTTPTTEEELELSEDVTDDTVLEMIASTAPLEAVLSDGAPIERIDVSPSLTALFELEGRSSRFTRLLQLGLHARYLQSMGDKEFYASHSTVIQDARAARAALAAEVNAREVTDADVDAYGIGRAEEMQQRAELDLEHLNREDAINVIRAAIESEAAQAVADGRRAEMGVVK